MDNFGSAGVAIPDHTGHDGPDLELLRARVRVQWVDVLEHDDFGDDEDFFDAGGNSLLVAEIMAALGAEFGVRVELRLFFAHPTVNELAGALAAHEAFKAVAR
ncbi:acyl carrier protein [Streptomyces europaeiscabiei]|uniref:Phosphopantetheine-binding protein n=1 Tax=Streptomyces europaeiscabiei TaxID=146819 RepID=A0ABU4NW38_9ACTN|nr:acyl carrier protein [Streptomyces europaeiscabiei]MDX2531374.1 phosphopantetheine-binding protein [Streptomyces europaeiscabiei]MDX2762735.1 phosphopantetheine-binding protein [Streptomyces europaeiscabiei]MDX2772531.1 phosphopantetheine-binding protein [Streptomyces europaeiscabiei]MDX3549973.1 phosphopantetheine-binding protein [Streptomyces europaeiscabiei]MDX3559227.1 phosphopantetheine-binding protein [Streptomyces europaeiscabiei]